MPATAKTPQTEILKLTYADQLMCGKKCVGGSLGGDMYGFAQMPTNDDHS